MTDTITALSTVPESALKLAQSGSFSIADLADKLAPSAPKADVPGFPDLPKQKVLSTDARRALDTVADLFGSFSLSDRRPLTDDELARLTRESVTISQVVKPLTERGEAIAEMVRTHMDAAAEKAKQASTRTSPRIMAGKAAGHYLLASPHQPHTVPVPGFEQDWEQRYTEGKASPDPSKLLSLYEAGSITRAEYLGLTREARVYDEAKVAEFIRKNPARGMEILGAITTRANPGAQLVSPKK